MKFQYLCHPVNDMEKTIQFYHDVLGCKEAWRVNDQIVGLEIPGSDVQIVLDEEDYSLPAGGQFVLDSVDSFFEKYKDQVKFIKEPMDIPPGRLAAFEDPSGNIIRIMDYSRLEK